MKTPGSEDSLDCDLGPHELVHDFLTFLAQEGYQHRVIHPFGQEGRTHTGAPSEEGSTRKMQSGYLWTVDVEESHKLCLRTNWYVAVLLLWCYKRSSFKWFGCWEWVERHVDPRALSAKSSLAKLAVQLEEE